MKNNRLQTAFLLCALAVAAFFVWKRTKPDEFFPNIGVRVPASAIVSHQTHWLLKAEEHRIVLQVPASAWPTLLTQFKAKSGFQDIIPNLKTNYGDFVMGRESFFPRRLSGANAGEFQVQGRDGYAYVCHFLRDNTTGQIWFVGWSPDN